MADNAASISYRTLTEPQKRHLRELVGPSGTTLFWRPANSGEQRCAQKLREIGLLEGSHISYSDAYYLSDFGLKLARGLVANPDA